MQAVVPLVMVMTLPLFEQPPVVVTATGVTLALGETLNTSPYFFIPGTDPVVMT